jgi:uncharacterized protein
MRALVRLAALVAAVLATVAQPALPATADTTAHNLAAGPFAQNWSDTAAISTNDNWDGVPSIVGYRGDGLAPAPGVDPRTVLADGAATPVDVLADQVNPSGLAVGGVAEFDRLADPTVALNGSNTADAPHLVIALVTSGRQNIVVSYTLRDLDGSRNDAVSPVAVQYRVGASDPYIDLPAGYEPDASDGPDLAGRATAKSVQLPAEADDQPLVFVRVLTTNAPGFDEWIGVDDIAVASTPIDSGPCSVPDTPINQVQGNGAAAALNGPVTVQGVVVGDYEGASPNLRGFYLQEQSRVDADPATSEGLFVFNGNRDDVELGQVVQVSGTAGEFGGQTQLSGVTAIENCGATANVAPADVTLPLPAAQRDVEYLERFEGMLVRLPQTLSVTEHFQLGRFGQVTLASGGRLRQPTAVASPGAEALALQAANAANRIMVDDAQNNQNPATVLFGRGGNPLSAANTLRAGDTASGIVGVLTYTWAGAAASGNAFRVRPLGALGGGTPNFLPANPRPEAPPNVGGTLRVASVNLLNYFNTFGANACSGGVGGAALDCRGADNRAEFERQWPKTVAVISALNADIIGVNELENDGYGPSSAIRDLVNKLNAASAPGTYAFIDADARSGHANVLGSDAIKVALIYKPAIVTPIGLTGVLNTGAFGPYSLAGGGQTQRNRPTLAQTFQDAAGERFTVVVNHFKSKSSSCADNQSPVGPDPDSGDGQGNCNRTRTRAAEELAAWLAGDPTGAGDPDVLIIGDLNAYAKEDPISALAAAGYSDMIASRSGPESYSYAFDGQWGYLDHALASPSMRGQIAGAAEWHVNADEPAALDYNTDFKPPAQQTTLYAPDQFRAADHDPVLVGVGLGSFVSEGVALPLVLR